mgnify:CR=1 FL=1
MRWAPLVGVILVLPSGLAHELHAELQVQGTTTFRGVGNTTFEWTGGLLDARLGHEPTTSAFSVNGSATLLTYSFWYSNTNGSSPIGYTRYFIPLASDDEELGKASGMLRTGHASWNASLRLIPNDPVRGLIRGNFSVEPGTDIHENLYYPSDAQPYEVGTEYYPSFGSQLGCDGLELEEFAGRLIITGQEVTFNGQMVDTRWSDEGPAIGSGSTLVIRTTKVLVVEGTIGIPAGFDCAHWFQAAQSIDSAVEGDLLIANARGTGTWNGTDLPAGIHLFQVQGPMRLRADLGQPTGAWAIQGEPDFLALNAAAFWDSRVSPLASIAAIGAAAALIGVLAKWGRAWLSLIPGLNLAEPFGNPQRVRILATVAEHPGIDQSELAVHSMLGRATVRHHLNILARNDLVAERRIGTRRTYTLNDGSYEFPVLPGATVTAGQATAIARHPVRQALLAALQSSECDFESLRMRLNAQAQPFNRDAATYHLGLLLKHGLVKRRQEGRKVFWSATVDLESLKAVQKNRLLALGDLNRILDAMTNPFNEKDLYRRLRSQRWRGSMKALSRKLDLLVAVGYARRIGETYERT